MRNFNIELTLLSVKDIFGNEDGNGKLEVLEKYGIQAALSDLALITGAYAHNAFVYRVIDDSSLKGRSGYYYTKDIKNNLKVCVVGKQGKCFYDNVDSYNCTIRPVLKLPSDIFSKIVSSKKINHGDYDEIELGEYPQYITNEEVQKNLEYDYQKKYLNKTGNFFNFYERNFCTKQQNFQLLPVIYHEYSYNYKKYIRIRINPNWPPFEGCRLSNGKIYKNGDYAWIELLPVIWLIDYENERFISKKGLVSGILFDKKEKNNTDFLNTEMKKYLNEYMLHDLFQDVDFKNILIENSNIDYDNQKKMCLINK